MNDLSHQSPEELAEQLRLLVGQLQKANRNDLLLRAIGAPLLEELRIEAARPKLSRLLLTKNYRFFLVDYNKEVELQPVHKAVYLLFLAHPEGIEFNQEELDGILTAAREKIAKAKEYAVSCEYPDPSEFLTDVYAE